MKVIDISILVYENNELGKFYLQYMKNQGVRPREIIVMRTKLTLRIRGAVRKARKFFREIKNHLFSRINQASRDYIDAKKFINDQFPLKIAKRFEFQEYADSVKHVTVDGELINSNSVFEVIEKSESQYFLFSGGGIVNSRLLTLEGKKFLHVHPGIVPDIKGADCLFWSVLYKGVPGYSCFFMSEQIDEGDILFKKEYSLKDVKLPNYKESALNSLYQAILDSLDLHLRAQCFVDFMNESNLVDTGIANLNFLKQSPNEGRTFFIMSPEVKKLAVMKLLANKSINCKSD